MTALLGLLSLGSSALKVHSAGVATAGKNIANVNTEGYQRESVDIRSLRGMGAEAGGNRRAGDMLLARREQETSGNHGNASAASNALGAVERAVGGGKGTDLIDAMSEFFAAVNDVAATPLDYNLRLTLVTRARSVTDVFRRTAIDIAEARKDADSRIGDLATEASRLAADIAKANVDAKTDRDPVILDRRDLDARKLAEIIGGQVRVDGDGMLRFVTASGVVVVDGDKAATIQANPSIVPGGYRSVVVVDGSSAIDVTGTLTGGKIFGELTARDTVGGQAATDLDTLAVDLAGAVNGQHAVGEGLDGVAGRDLFENSVGGAVVQANDFYINPTIEADPRMFAAAPAGSGPMSGANGNALAVLGQRVALVAGVGTRTLTDEAIRILTVVGHAKAGADFNVSLEEARLQSLADLRDSLSGVSTQEEMTRLAAYQAAANATTNFIATVSEMLKMLTERL